MTATRRLAAIMAIDVAGYSRLILARTRLGRCGRATSNRDTGWANLAVGRPTEGRKSTELAKNTAALLAKSGSLCYNLPNRRISSSTVRAAARRGCRRDIRDTV